jgi:biotin transport system substrate-specific component
VRSNAATLRLVLVPGAGVVTDVVLVAAGAGLIAGAAQVAIRLPFTPVPITGQTFAVLLVGASLGTVRGGSSALLYVLLGVTGVPVYAHAAHGFAVIGGASGGYLVSYPFASALVGWLSERRWDRRFSSAIRAMLTGNVVIYLFGLPWLAVVLHTGLEKTLELGLYPFVPGDTFKLYLAAAALPVAWRIAARDPLLPEAKRHGGRVGRGDLGRGDLDRCARRRAAVAVEAGAGDRRHRFGGGSLLRGGRHLVRLPRERRQRPDLDRGGGACRGVAHRHAGAPQPRHP